MFLLYLDASGTDKQSDQSTKHFVLVGLSMHERSWFSLDRDVQVLKNAYRYPEQDPEKLELHVRQFNVTIKEQDEVPDFENLSRVQRRSEVLEGLPEVRQRPIWPAARPSSLRPAGFVQLPDLSAETPCAVTTHPGPTNPERLIRKSNPTAG